MSRKHIIHLGLSGASGRMGKAIRKAVSQKNSGFRIASHWPKKKGSRDFSPSDAHSIQLVVDFSAPALMKKALQWCLLHKKPFVSGTTGLSVQDRNLLKKASRQIPLLYEANMSWGVWQMSNWLKQMPIPKDRSLQLDDIHHKYKKDKPSGTALKLLDAFPAKVQKKIDVQCVRKGLKFGVHRMHFIAASETLVIEHQAFNRSIFAEGALRAALWLVSQKPGLYSMNNIYGNI